MRAKSYHNYPMPSADLVLDLIYSAPETDNKFLSFYEPYICQASIEHIYADDGCSCGTRLNEDLRQEILITFVQSLPVMFAYAMMGGGKDSIILKANGRAVTERRRKTARGVLMSFSVKSTYRFTSREAKCPYIPICTNGIWIILK